MMDANFGWITAMKYAFWKMIFAVMQKGEAMQVRQEILDKAKDCVCGQRQQDYGNPEDNFAAIADFWTIYINIPEVVFTPKDVAMMMALLKVARIRTGKGTMDSYVDLAGYAACAGEIAERSVSNEKV